MIFSGILIKPLNELVLSLFTNRKSCLDFELIPLCVIVVITCVFSLVLLKSPYNSQDEFSFKFTLISVTTPE